ncbi:MAG: acetate uptake transporter [Pseudochelatococcus sp.]|jgi:succinate-acetate transporter protein|uniref:acetate uptake transporter n=1 Tax=Pseudochelatococcus sp. TaxID=2020869 RepID=UPI003D940583
MNITLASQSPPVAAPPVVSPETNRHGNPAVVGLAGFGMTTLLLQFHNVGWASLGPVIGLGVVFGGLAQFIAGLQEAKTGNNFGYCAFTSYGAFWIAFCLIQIASETGLFPVSAADVGWFLVVWTIYTAIMTVGAMRISTGLGLVFITLLIGFILLVIGHFGAPVFNVIAGYELMICAALALYVMAHTIFLDVFGHDVLPVGKPMIR